MEQIRITAADMCAGCNQSCNAEPQVRTGQDWSALVRSQDEEHEHFGSESSQAASPMSTPLKHSKPPRAAHYKRATAKAGNLLGQDDQDASKQ